MFVKEFMQIPSFVVDKPAVKLWRYKLILLWYTTARIGTLILA